MSTNKNEKLVLNMEKVFGQLSTSWIIQKGKRVLDVADLFPKQSKQSSTSFQPQNLSYELPKNKSNSLHELFFVKRVLERLIFIDQFQNGIPGRTEKEAEKEEEKEKKGLQNRHLLHLHQQSEEKTWQWQRFAEDQVLETFNSIDSNSKSLVTLLHKGKNFTGIPTSPSSPSSVPSSNSSSTSTLSSSSALSKPSKTQEWEVETYEDFIIATFFCFSFWDTPVLASTCDSLHLLELIKTLCNFSAIHKVAKTKKGILASLLGKYDRKNPMPLQLSYIISSNLLSSQMDELLDGLLFADVFTELLLPTVLLTRTDTNYHNDQDELQQEQLKQLKQHDINWPKRKQAGQDALEIFSNPILRLELISEVPTGIFWCSNILFRKCNVTVEDIIGFLTLINRDIARLAFMFQSQVINKEFWLSYSVQTILLEEINTKINPNPRFIVKIDIDSTTIFVYKIDEISNKQKKDLYSRAERVTLLDGPRRQFNILYFSLVKLTDKQRITKAVYEVRND